jgi:hypothetical protein
MDDGEWRISAFIKPLEQLQSISALVATDRYAGMNWLCASVSRRPFVDSTLAVENRHVNERGRDITVVEDRDKCCIGVAQCIAQNPRLSRGSPEDQRFHWRRSIAAVT